MAVSVRMDPLLERELEAAARLQGMTKSQFIIDAVERALGRKNPYELLLKVRQEMAAYDTSGGASEPARAGESTRQRVRRVLKARHEAARAPEPAAPAPAARKRAGKGR